MTFSLPCLKSSSLSILIDLFLRQAQELNKQFAQKIRDRDNIIIRVREANRQLKADSSNQNGFLNKTKPGLKKRFDSERTNQSVDDLESEIEDLKSQLEGRDDEVKVGKFLFIYHKKSNI